MLNINAIFDYYHHTREEHYRQFMFPQQINTFLNLYNLHENSVTPRNTKYLKWRKTCLWNKKICLWNSEAEPTLLRLMVFNRRIPRCLKRTLFLKYKLELFLLLNRQLLISILTLKFTELSRKEYMTIISGI